MCLTGLLADKFNSRRMVGQPWPDKALYAKSRYSNHPRYCCGNMYQVNNNGLIILLHTKS